MRRVGLSAWSGSFAAAGLVRAAASGLQQAESRSFGPATTCARCTCRATGPQDDILEVALRAVEALPGELREPRAGLIADPAAGFSPWRRRATRPSYGFSRMPA